VSQYDLELFAEVEKLLGRKLDERVLKEKTVLESLRLVSQAKRLAKVRLEAYELQTKQSLKGKDTVRGRPQLPGADIDAASKFSVAPSHKRKNKSLDSAR
jgi:hypothetical protein